jgi:hypothetical protein
MKTPTVPGTFPKSIPLIIFPFKYAGKIELEHHEGMKLAEKPDLALFNALSHKLMKRRSK